jgi:RNase adapter protein RapZ
VELTVITGLSGAGKSQAMSAFEDAGWFCVDNLPPRLLDALGDLFTLEGAHAHRAAVVCDVRGGVWFGELAARLARLSTGEGARVRVLFLEASDDALLNRFRETRRPHPLAEAAGSVLEGIARERRLLTEVRARADVVIDTTGMTIWQLRRAVVEALIDPEGRSRLQVTFMSFGYKHGAPREADLLFDVRFLRNPHYVPELSALTGLDAPVAEYVAAAPGMTEFRARLEALLDFLLPAYAEEGRRNLVVAFGCTGGRHRSVAIAEGMARRYGGGDYDVGVTHRDVAREPEAGRGGGPAAPSVAAG